MQRRTVLGVAFVAGASGALAQTTGGSRERQPDFGDVAEGRYFGDVISDSKGSSRNDVTLTVTRTGLNRVRITSDYPRLPVVEVSLQRALDKIVQSRGDTVFLYDWSRKPAKLDVSFNNEVSWSGTRQ
jgi:hypothetical protein